MNAASFTPAVLKGAIVVIEPDSGLVQRVIPLQYNPDGITRTLAPQGMADTGDQLEAMRLTGPPIETIKLEADIDAADLLDQPDQHAEVVEVGLLGHLAALELLAYPSSSSIVTNDTLASFGTLEIAPVMAPQPLFVWSRHRVLPVRLTEFTVTEELFDTRLQPIRAKVQLSMRVLTTTDIPMDRKVGSLFMNYLRQKESLATRQSGGRIDVTGVTSI